MLRLIKAIRLASLGMLLVGLGVSSTWAGTATKATPKRKSTASKKTPVVQKTTGSSKTMQNVTSRNSRGAKSKRSSRRERGQKAPTSERIFEIQTALAKDGSYTG